VQHAQKHSNICYSYIRMLFKAVEEDEALNCIKDAHFSVLFDTLCSGDDKCLAALDSVHVKCLLENFNRARLLFKDILKDEPVRSEKFEIMTDNLEEFLRKEMPGHLTEDSPSSSHSYQHAFGNSEERAKEVEMYCHQCNSAYIWIEEFKRIIHGMDPLPEGHPDTKKSLMQYLMEDILIDLETYIAHVVRQTHENVVDKKSIAGLKDTDVYIRCDWKMKQLSIAFRESMVHICIYVNEYMSMYFCIYIIYIFIIYIYIYSIYIYIYM
jgi:hypothetical protein